MPSASRNGFATPINNYNAVTKCGRLPVPLAERPGLVNDSQRVPVTSYLPRVYCRDRTVSSEGIHRSRARNSTMANCLVGLPLGFYIIGGLVTSLGLWQSLN